MSLWQKIKEIAQKMLGKKAIENVLNVTPCISDRMSDSIKLWADMYEGHSGWLREPSYDNPIRIVSLGLPQLIASEKARMATLEMKSEISAPTEPVDKASEPNTNLNTDSKPNIGSGSTVMPSTAFKLREEPKPIGSTERAEFLNNQYKKLIKQIRRQLEYGIAKGGLVIKPYIVIYEDNNSSDTQNIKQNDIQDDFKISTTNNTNENKNSSKSVLHYNNDLPKAEIEFDFIQADRFFPLSFDANGKVVEAAFIQTKIDKARERVYIRLEYHKLENRRVTVKNLAYESTDMNLSNSNDLRGISHLGKQIPLKAVPEWASLQETTIIENVDRLLFAYFKMPEANTIDPYSPLGVSGYSRVVQLIKDADMQYSRMLWEFEGGELAVDVDRDALTFATDPSNGDYTVLPVSQQRLFRKIDLNTEDTYNVFAPTLRDESIIHGLNTILTRIEDCTGLSRGTLSEVTSQEAKTATELKILKQRSYATNADIQAALQDALEDAVYVMDVYATLYEVTPDGEYEVSYEWDDSIIVDSESELSKRITLQQNGLASKLENRMWYFGETENQARAALQQIDEEATQAMIQNAQAQIMQAQAGGNSDDEDNNKSPADKTSDKKSSGKQADVLDNPNKSRTVDQVKGKNK